MSHVKDLIAQAREHLAVLEGEAEAVLERAEPTQLRVAVHRLGLFVEHLAGVGGHAVSEPAPVPEPAAPEPEIVAEAEADETPKRRGRKA